MRPLKYEQISLLFLLCVLVSQFCEAMTEKRRLELK
jgi:hypothetical protein